MRMMDALGQEKEKYEKDLEQLHDEAVMHYLQKEYAQAFQLFSEVLLYFEH